MTELPYTTTNVLLVQEFLDETKTRMMRGVDLTFSAKASEELKKLSINYGITRSDIETAVLNLSAQNYFRGIDPSGVTDFNVCAFKANVGTEKIEIYLKYGLEVDGLQILLFSNHEPERAMKEPFRSN